MKRVKDKKKGKITPSFTSPEKDLYIYVYEAFTWNFFKKGPIIHY
jgi:hypothetical protein